MTSPHQSIMASLIAGDTERQSSLRIVLNLNRDGCEAGQANAATASIPQRGVARPGPACCAPFLCLMQGLDSSPGEVGANQRTHNATG
jgi:hypothetical protein